MIRVLGKSEFFAALALAIAMLVGGIQAAGAQGTGTQRVEFRAGATDATITDQLASGEAIRYLLNARDGQFLSVSLRPDNGDTYYIVYVPGGDILYESSQGGNEYHGQLYVSGDHEIEVFYNGNLGTVSNYDIVFEVTDTGGNAAAAPEDAGEEPRRPASVEAILDEARATCQSYENGTFDPTGAVVAIDLTDDGLLDALIDESRFSCNGSPSLYCGSGGCGLHAVIGQETWYFQAEDWGMIEWDGRPILLIARDGGWCGGAGAQVCYEAVVWSDGQMLTVMPNSQ